MSNEAISVCQSSDDIEKENKRKKDENVNISGTNELRCLKNKHLTNETDSSIETIPNIATAITLDTPHQTKNAPSSTTEIDIYSFFLAMAFQLPGFMQKKPLLLLATMMPFIDVILDFISAGIV